MPQHPYRRLLLAFTLLLVTRLLGVEGIDLETGGHWRDPTVKKPWSVDGKNIYGTDGYYFFNVTDLIHNERSANNRPVDENLRASLPPYIVSVTPTAGALTAQSNGYLGIDDPTGALPATVESGVLAIRYPKERLTNDVLQIDLGELPKPHGIRVGILTNNADKAGISPQAVSLRTEKGDWSRSIIDIPDNMQGAWLFFNIKPEHSNQSVIISLTGRRTQVVTIGGLVFDSPNSADPKMPLSVTTESPVIRNSEVVWRAVVDKGEDTKQTWEYWAASKFLKSYRENAARLLEIDSELNALPVPYGGEPTGSGGYLTQWQSSAFDMTRVSFTWKKEVEVDAVALLPLRLYLGDEKGLTENAYWPGDIEIRAKTGEKFQSLARLSHSQKEIQQSLPEFVTFDPIKTTVIDLLFTNLPKRIGNNQHAGGFSEVCIFSGDANIAPRSRVRPSSSREGFRVYSNSYLIDEQTPLGLPELGPRTSGGLGFSIHTPTRIHKKPIVYTLSYPSDQLIDSVRLDPAIIYKPGQAFPVRFTVALLDASDNVLQIDDTYLNTAFKGPGLNPYIARFDETNARAVRLSILESSQPSESAKPWFQISEITPAYRGKPLPRIAEVQSSHANPIRYPRGLSDPSGLRLYWSNKSACDGMTQSGKLLPHREWLEGLSQRQKLLEEQKILRKAQEVTRGHVRAYSLWGTIGLVLLVIVSALYLTIHHRLKIRRQMRDTRERIASDLHDDVGSNLGTINLHAEYLMDQVAEPELIERLKAIFKLAKESTFGLREVLHTTAPRIARAQALIPHLEELAALSLFNINYSIKLDPAINGIFSESLIRKRLILFYKEALYNIQHHAQCSEVTIKIRVAGDQIELEIKDNGVGISEERLNAASTLRTLRLRAKDLKAKLIIRSKLNQGTTLLLTIPIS